MGNPEKTAQSVTEKSEATAIPSPLPSTLEKGKDVAKKSTLPPKKPSKAQLKLAALKLHIILTRLNKILGNHSSRDNLLCLTAYSVLFLSTLTPHLRNPRLAKRLTPSLAGLYGLISDIRIFQRLFGLVGVYHWGLSVYNSPPSDPVIRAITYTQVLFGVLFQAMENVAYLSMHKIVKLDKTGKRESSLWLWSCRFWAGHVLGEFLRVGREIYLEKQKVKKGELVTAEEKKAHRASWIRDIISNSAWAPLTVHWSVDGGAISTRAVGFFGIIAGLVSFERAWKATA